MSKRGRLTIAIRTIIIIDRNISIGQTNGHTRLDCLGTDPGTIQVIISSIRRKPRCGSPTGCIAAGRINIGIIIDQTTHLHDAKDQE